MVYLYDLSAEKRKCFVVPNNLAGFHTRRFVMRRKFFYEIDIAYSPEDKAYVARVPELQGCVTHGSTYVEALKYAEEAIACWLEDAETSGEPIPEPVALKEFSGKFQVRLPQDLHRSLSIKAKKEKTSINRILSHLVERYL